MARRFPPPWSVEELDALCERGPQKQYEISLLFLWHGGADAGCRIQDRRLGVDAIEGGLNHWKFSSSLARSPLPPQKSTYACSATASP
jgi:hypothetical protein